jgi:hypothetical protein
MFVVGGTIVNIILQRSAWIYYPGKKKEMEFEPCPLCFKSKNTSGEEPRRQNARAIPSYAICWYDERESKMTKKRQKIEENAKIAKCKE